MFYLLRCLGSPAGATGVGVIMGGAITGVGSGVTGVGGGVTTTTCRLKAPVSFARKFTFIACTGGGVTRATGPAAG